MTRVRHHKTKAIVIKGVNFRESDRILSVISGAHGRMTLLARSARKPGGKLAASSQFLCYSEFELYKSRDFPVINSADVIDSFMGVAGDINKLKCASHCAELAYDCTVEEQSAEGILRLLLNTLYLLSNDIKEPELLARIFELRLLTEIGYPPHTESCVICGETLKEPYIFNFQKGGLICNKCGGGSTGSFGSINISLGTVKTIYHITKSKLETVFSFSVSDEILNELWEVNSTYIFAQLGKQYIKFRRT